MIKKLFTLVAILMAFPNVVWSFSETCFCPFDVEACYKNCEGSSDPFCGRSCLANYYRCNNVDYNTNYTIFRPSSGIWYSKIGYNPNSVFTNQWGLPGDVPMFGFYPKFTPSGNVSTSFGVWRPNNGTWYLCTYASSSLCNQTGFQSIQFGLPGDIPIDGDVDQDDFIGQGTDLIVWRPSTGNWYIKSSEDKTITVTQFGLPGDYPFVEDFDGDLKGDLGVWRPSNGTWYIRLSSKIGSTAGDSILVKQWGLPGDVPVPGSFTNDAKADLVVWRPSTGTWYTCYSDDGFDCREGTVLQFGLPDDLPLAIDIDGDNKRDRVVWRPSNGSWYTYTSGNCGGSVNQWGVKGDLPSGVTPRDLLNYLKGSYRNK